MAVPDILVLLVHYRNGPMVERFIHHLHSLASRDGQSLEIALADNSGDWNPATRLPLSLTLAEGHGNCGYLTGCAHALETWRRQTRGMPRWVAVLNSDLTLEPGWAACLERAESFPGIGVVAPDVRLPSGVQQNPHLLHRPSPFSFRLYLVLHLHPALYSVAHALHEAKQWINTGKGKIRHVGHHPRPLWIYAPHGSAMFFHQEFFLRGGTLFYESLMYGEEIFIAEQLRQLGLQALWLPEFRVTHHEHGVTAGATSEWRRCRQLESLSFLQARYFQENRTPHASG